MALCRLRDIIFSVGDLDARDVEILRVASTTRERTREREREESREGEREEEITILCQSDNVADGDVERR